MFFFVFNQKWTSNTSTLKDADFLGTSNATSFKFLANV